eukprot:Rhum_TRINITY_DN20761_c0_g1::Rhum_TRINITY_DN20761_c0_g1_i1::g.171981::m.171981
MVNAPQRTLCVQLVQVSLLAGNGVGAVEKVRVLVGSDVFRVFLDKRGAVDDVLKHSFGVAEEQHVDAVHHHTSVTHGVCTHAVHLLVERRVDSLEELARYRRLPALLRHLQQGVQVVLEAAELLRHRRRLSRAADFLLLRNSFQDAERAQLLWHDALRRQVLPAPLLVQVASGVRGERALYRREDGALLRAEQSPVSPLLHEGHHREQVLQVVVDVAWAEERRCRRPALGLRQRVLYVAEQRREVALKRQARCVPRHLRRDRCVRQRLIVNLRHRGGCRGVRLRCPELGAVVRHQAAPHLRAPTLLRKQSTNGQQKRSRCEDTCAQFPPAAVFHHGFPMKYRYCSFY